MKTCSLNYYLSFIYRFIDFTVNIVARFTSSGIKLHQKNKKRLLFVQDLIYYYLVSGSLAQLGERQLDKLEVTGSRPVGSI